MRRVLIFAVLTAVVAACGGNTVATTTTTRAAAAPTTSATTRASSATTSAGATTTTAADDDSSTTVATFSGSGSQRYCELSKQYQDASDALGSNTPEDVKKQIEFLKRALPEIIKVVPPEIKADWETLLPALTQFIQALERVGYDFTKLTEQDISMLQSPEVTAAGERIDTHGQQVCGIES